MNVGELCTRSVIIGWREESVIDVAQRMRAGHVGNVVVVSGDPNECIPAGMVTDRDIVVAVLAQAPHLVGKLTLGDIASRNVVTIREDAEVHVAIETMRLEGVHRLPVVDEAGRLVGILSRDDVIEFLAEEMRALAAVPERSERAERALRH